MAVAAQKINSTYCPPGIYATTQAVGSSAEITSAINKALNDQTNNGVLNPDLEGVIVKLDWDGYHTGLDTFDNSLVDTIVTALDAWGSGLKFGFLLFGNTFSTSATQAGKTPNFIKNDHGTYGGGSGYGGNHISLSGNTSVRKGFTVALGRSLVVDQVNAMQTALANYSITTYPSQYFGMLMWETAHGLGDKSEVGDYDATSFIQGYNDVCTHGFNLHNPSGYMYMAGVNFVSGGDKSDRALVMNNVLSQGMGICGPDTDPTNANLNTQEILNGVEIGLQYFKYQHRTELPVAIMTQVERRGDGSTSGVNNWYTVGDRIHFGRLPADGFTTPASNYPTDEGDWPNWSIEAPYVFVTVKDDSLGRSDWESQAQPDIRARVDGADPPSGWDNGDFSAWLGSGTVTPPVTSVVTVDDNDTEYSETGTWEDMPAGVTLSTAAALHHGLTGTTAVSGAVRRTVITMVEDNVDANLVVSGVTTDGNAMTAKAGSLIQSTSASNDDVSLQAWEYEYTGADTGAVAITLAAGSGQNVSFFIIDGTNSQAVITVGTATTGSSNDQTPLDIQFTASFDDSEAFVVIAGQNISASTTWDHGETELFDDLTNGFSKALAKISNISAGDTFDIGGTPSANNRRAALAIEIAPSGGAGSDARRIAADESGDYANFDFDSIPAFSTADFKLAFPTEAANDGSTDAAIEIYKNGALFNSYTIDQTTSTGTFKTVATIANQGAANWDIRVLDTGTGTYVYADQAQIDYNENTTTTITVDDNDAGYSDTAGWADLSSPPSVDSHGRYTQGGGSSGTLTLAIGASITKAIVIVTREDATDADRGIATLTLDSVDITGERIAGASLATTSSSNADVEQDWYYVDISGAQAGVLAWTFDGTVANQDVAMILLTGATTGAPEATATDTTGSSSNSTALSTSITTVADNALIIAAIVSHNPVTTTWDNSETEIYDDGASGMGKTAAYLEKATAGSQTIGGTPSSGARRCMGVISIAPSSAADARSTADNGSGDVATFDFGSVPAFGTATFNVLFPAAAATDGLTNARVKIFKDNVEHSSATVDQTTNTNTFKTVFTLSSAETAGDWDLRIYDDAGTGSVVYADQAQLIYDQSPTFTLSAGQGAYTFSGKDATLQELFILSADQGAYNFTGQATSLIASAVLDAEAASYTFSGADAALSVNENSGVGVVSLTVRNPTITSTRRKTRFKR